MPDRFRGELYCGFAEKDPNAAPPTRQALSEALSGCPVDYSYEVHPGAEHGYALPDRDIHDKRAANRDWELIFAIVPPAALGLNCPAHNPKRPCRRRSRVTSCCLVLGA
jgi:dienelactone hydrolase